MNNNITEAQIFLTRECNFSCHYCKLTKRKLNELSLEQWKDVFLFLEDIDIQTVKILGGEPTVKEWLVIQAE
jgi:molybdenum cofactor biosynthesis enzyme MoaA